MQLDEAKLDRTIRNRLWRLNNLYWIKPKDAPKMHFRLNWGQKEILMEKSRAKARRMINLKVRQIGISTLGVIYHLDDCLFSTGGNVSAGILDLTLEDAKKKIAMATFACEHLGEHPDDTDDGEIARIVGKLAKEQLKMQASVLNLRWTNGSSMRAATSMIGSTLQLFHISDAGEMAFQYPERMDEVTKSMEAIPRTGHVLIEGTHAGGKSGWFYEQCQRALRNDTQHLADTEALFTFLSWWRHPEYLVSQELLDRRGLKPETREYFDKLEADEGVVLDDRRKLWWEIKEADLGRNMATQYPSTASEAWNAQVPGAIYGDIIGRLRAGGQIKRFEHEHSKPLFTFWDIGNSDHTVIWLAQVLPREILWIDYYRNKRETPAHYADVTRRWEREYGHLIATHFLPHDGKMLERGSGTNYIGWLAEAGVRNVAVVPRAKDRWDGINHLRELLKKSVFHARVDAAIQVDGVDEFSGLAALEAYRTKEVAAGGVLKEEPVHDETSHTADAARTLSEAHKLGMIPMSGWTADGEFSSSTRKRKSAIMRVGTSMKK